MCSIIPLNAILSNGFFFLIAHWDEQFHHKMVDNRGFMVSRGYTVSVQMMHRTGWWRRSVQNLKL